MTQCPTSYSRRSLRFDHLDEVTRDADALAEAERAGKLVQLGSWTLGQACAHVAAFMDFAFDGYPFAVPWFVRLVARRLKNVIVNKPMKPGRKIPGIPGGTVSTEQLPTAEGIERLRRACARLELSAPMKPNPLLGPLTPEEWKKLNLRHAELHLSFFVAK